MSGEDERVGDVERERRLTDVALARHLFIGDRKSEVLVGSDAAGFASRLDQVTSGLSSDPSEGTRPGMSAIGSRGDGHVPSPPANWLVYRRW